MSNQGSIWEGGAFCVNSNSVVARVADLSTLSAGENADSFVLVADYYPPSVLAPLIPEYSMKGVVFRRGSLAEHTAGLLNAHGVQLAIVPDLPHVAPGLAILIDGTNERVHISSDIAYLEAKLLSICSGQNSEKYSSKQITHAGELIKVSVDGNTAAQLSQGLNNGATEVGILRSEWVGWSEPRCPTIATYHSLFDECATAVQPHRLNIRLLDIGGDKIPNWASEAAEDINSPLSKRGIRSLDLFPTAFFNQLNAISEVAKRFLVGLVIPMVTDVNDISIIRQKIYEIASKQAFNNIDVGAMIEVPAAAVDIDNILSQVSFVRIGPGDLTQFTLAKSRINISPKELSGSSIHPAVLTLIKQVACCGRKMNKPTSLCLDFEPREPLLDKLLNNGVRTFCVAASNVPSTINRLQEFQYNHN